MTIVYDPLTYRTVVARPGEIPYKFWSVNKHVIDAASAGICTLHSGDDAPADTSKLWLDLTMPENAVGAVKAYNGTDWVALTPALFYSHIAGGAGGFVTNLEMETYVSGLLGVTIQAWSENLDQWSALDPTAKEDTGVAATLIAAHEAAGDPHPGYLTPAEGDAAYQPLDSDLMAIAALSTTAYGRALLALADAAALRTAAGAVIGTDIQAYDADLASWAAITRASGYDTFAATPSSANLAALLSDETGSGAAVFGTGPTISGAVLTGTADVQQAMVWSGDISPAQITATENDYAPTGFSTATVLRLNSDASRNITGLAGGADGRIILIHNIGSFAIVLVDESASSTAANRFALNSDVTLQADQSTMLQYDATTSRWRVIGGTGSGSGGGVAYTYNATAPGSPTAGDFWFNPDIGVLFQYINDGTSSQWVEFGGGLYGYYGDLLSTNNLSDVADVQAARKNLNAASIDAGAALGLLINPHFEISQENGTTAGAAASAYYAADQWYALESSDAVLSVQNVADPFGSTATLKRLKSSIKATATTADASLSSAQYIVPCAQPIEGTVWRSLGWGTADARAVDIVFIAQCSVTGTYPVSVRNAASNRSYVTTVSLTANTPTVCLVTIPGDTGGTWVTTNAHSVTLWIGAASGSDFQASSLNTWEAANRVSHSTCTNWAASGTTEFFQVAYCQAFPAGVLPFTSAAQITGEALQLLLDMRRTYDVEAAKCYRYYYKHPFTQFMPIATGFCYTTTNALANLKPPVPMRTTPILAVSNVAHFSVYAAGGSDVALTNLTLSAFSSSDIVRLDATTASGLVAGNGTLITMSNASTSFALSARM